MEILVIFGAFMGSGITMAVALGLSRPDRIPKSRWPIMTYCNSRRMMSLTGNDRSGWRRQKRLMAAANAFWRMANQISREVECAFYFAGLFVSWRRQFCCRRKLWTPAFWEP